MTDNPAVESAEPESPPHGPEVEPPLADTRKRSRPKKFRAVIVLGVIGFALLVLGFAIYPRRAEPPAAVAPSLNISGSSDNVGSDIGGISYRVDQIGPSLAKVTVEVAMGVYTSWPTGSALGIDLTVTGQQLAGCSPNCRVLHPIVGGGGPTVEADADVTRLTDRPLGVVEARAYFLVDVAGFGAPSNGVTAEVALPDFSVSGMAGPQTLALSYDNIPSASSYDWSADPPQYLGTSDAGWLETVANGTTPSRIVQATNHAAQQQDSASTLIAGILFGIAGGALVAAVQEALHD